MIMMLPYDHIVDLIICLTFSFRKFKADATWYVKIADTI